MGREQLRAAHAGDRAAGLSDRQIGELHVHFVSCESSQGCRACGQGAAQRRAQLRTHVVCCRRALLPLRPRASRPPAAAHAPPPPPPLPRPPRCAAAGMQALARAMVVEGEPLLRLRVVGTAAVYWRTFYLRNDFRAADPRCIAPACLFLAAKTGGRAEGVAGAMGWAGGWWTQPASGRARCMLLTPATPVLSLPNLIRAEETPLHSKLLLHYARRLAAKAGALPPPDLPQLVAAEAQLLVSLWPLACGRLLGGRGSAPAPAGRRLRPVQQAWPHAGPTGRPACPEPRSSPARLRPHPHPHLRPRLHLPQEALDGALLVFSPYPSLARLLQDSGLAGSQKACEAAW